MVGGGGVQTKVVGDPTQWVGGGGVGKHGLPIRFGLNSHGRKYKNRAS